MQLTVRSITVDCADPYRLALWWCEVFGVRPSQDDHPGDPEALCSLGEGQPRLLFERVPEGKSCKNRVHVDLQPVARRDEEADRILQLGATFVADHRLPDGSGWVVLADPEGNEFCIEGGAPAL
jgi:predicted enzyme related to lactoylglutathione lyase